MGTMYYFFIFVYCSCLASFANCVAYRIQKNMNWVSGRSICVNCGHELQFKDLIPVWSCLFYRAHCPYCKTKYGWNHFLYEFAFGLLGILCLYISEGLVFTVGYMLYVCLVSINLQVWYRVEVE